MNMDILDQLEYIAAVHAIKQTKREGIKLSPLNPIRKIEIKNNAIKVMLNSVAEYITFTFTNDPDIFNSPIRL